MSRIARVAPSEVGNGSAANDASDAPASSRCTPARCLGILRNILKHRAGVQRDDAGASLASFAAEPLPTSLGATRAILDILNEADAQNAAGRHAEALALVQSGLAIAPE